MVVVNFIIYFLIALYCFGLIVYGFYDRMCDEMPSLGKYREVFDKCFIFLDDYIGSIPLYFGNFIAWLLIKLGDFFNFVCNLFKKKK